MNNDFVNVKKGEVSSDYGVMYNARLAVEK